MLTDTLGPVLVADRGAMARRVIRTVKRLGLQAVAVYSGADAELPFVREADEAVPLGPASPERGRLDAGRVLAAARASGARSVHPGHGALAGDAGFAQAVIDAGLTWIGSPPAVLDRLSDRLGARNLLADAGVPVPAGTREPVTDLASALREAARIGYPVAVKATGGGGDGGDGGGGPSVAYDAESLGRAFEQAARAADRFAAAAAAGGAGDALAGPAVLLERWVERARHVEVQILGLPGGRVLALGERDCSARDGHGPVAAESPSPGIPSELRERLSATAVLAGEAAGCLGAGTVELLAGPGPQELVVLRVSAGLRAEHLVTELVTGLDLVELQLRVAAGESPEVRPEPRGHAIGLRVCAEEPQRAAPGSGTITRWEEPGLDGVRVDSGYEAGNTVIPFYDPLMAGLGVVAGSRAEALEKARKAVAAFTVEGPANNLRFCGELLENVEFVTGGHDTGLVARMRAGRA